MLQHEINDYLKKKAFKPLTRSEFNDLQSELIELLDDYLDFPRNIYRFCNDPYDNSQIYHEVNRQLDNNNIRLFFYSVPKYINHLSNHDKEFDYNKAPSDYYICTTHFKHKNGYMPIMKWKDYKDKINQKNTPINEQKQTINEIIKEVQNKFPPNTIFI